MRFKSGHCPLTGEQRDKMLTELHQDPAMGHMKKGSQLKPLSSMRSSA